MKKKSLFSGVATALVTPFLGGEIDFDAFGKIIEMQISAGIDALVVGGTTGEVSCLDFEERQKLYSFATEKIAGRVPVILGTGSNNTATAIKLTKLACELGADGALVVTPYYNKGTEDGITGHYLSVAECSDLPIVIYNVPSRTTVNVSIKIIDALANHENIVGIKEASDSCERLASVCTLSDRLDIYSGNDSSTYAALALGGRGVISVLSNALPTRMLNITRSYFAGETASALSEQLSLLPLISALFREVNPTPIKYAMSLLGLCAPDMRLPLTPPTETTAKLVEQALTRIGISRTP